MSKIRGIIMLSYHVEASRGNKKFIMSVLTALNKLKADDFVQLYLKAQDPAVYKLTQDDGDPHTKLLGEIAYHENVIHLSNDHAEIIIQAMYAAPSISNPTKAVAMLMMGATLDYEDFVSRFGKGGDLEPKAFEKHEIKESTNIYRAYRAGLVHSDDVRFLIDKAGISKEIFKNNERAGGVYIPQLYSGGFKFTNEGFSQFLDSSLDEHKVDLLSFAPKGFFETDYFIGLVESNIIPDADTLYEVLPELYRSGRVEVFRSLLSKFIEHADYHNIVRSPALTKILSGEQESDITAEQIEIKSIYKEAFDNYASSVINEVSKTKPGIAFAFVKDTLRNSFKANDLDHFSSVLKEATDATPVTDGRDPFDELYSHLAGYLIREMRQEGATANMKSMLVLLKDTVVSRMNDAVDMACQMPEVTYEEHKRNKRDDRVKGFIEKARMAGSDELSL
jgi:hypothetical protein